MSYKQDSVNKTVNKTFNKMFNKSTSELSSYLSNIHSRQELDNYIARHTTSALNFSEYYYEILRKKNITLADAVKSSRLDKYAYEILNETKPLTPGRDKILCLCIGANMNIRETNRSLKLCSLGILYTRNTRDAIVIYHINNNDWNLENINIDLSNNGLEILH